jgi:hypothetical protein
MVVVRNHAQAKRRGTPVDGAVMLHGNQASTAKHSLLKLTVQLLDIWAAADVGKRGHGSGG